MNSTLFWGFILTFGGLGLIWLGFIQLRKHPKFAKLNSRQANKRMLQLSFALYFSGFALTIYLMLH
jgi:threonine/homoserine/homoserine lactone efflux protein